MYKVRPHCRRLLMFNWLLIVVHHSVFCTSKEGAITNVWIYLLTVFYLIFDIHT